MDVPNGEMGVLIGKPLSNLNVMLTERRHRLKQISIRLR